MWFPIPFIVGCLIEIGLQITYSPTQKGMMRFASEIVFVDLVHHAFSVSLLFLPEVNRLFMFPQPSEKSNQHFLLFSISTMTLTVLLFTFGYGGFGPHPLQNLVLKSCLIIHFALSSHHIISQFRGISFLLNKWMLKPDDDRSRVERLQRHERWLAYPIVLLWFIARLLAFSSNQNLFSNIYFVTTIGALTAFTASWIFLNIGYPFQNRDKFFFGVRYLLIPLSAISQIGFMGIASVHGMEYLHIFLKMIRSSSVKRKIFWVCVLPFVCLTTILAIIRTSTFLYMIDNEWIRNVNAFSQSNQTIAVLLGVSWGLNWMHYYMDRKLFRMRHQETRRVIGSLLEGGRGATLPSS